MYNVVFAERAEQELIDISNYIYDESGSATTAIKVVTNITTRINERLSRFPNSGLVALITESGSIYRQLVVDRYYVIYRIEEREEETFVLVTNVFRDRRNKDAITSGLE